MSSIKHDLKANDCIYSDDDNKPFAIFDNPKKDGHSFAKAYQINNAWFLISDPTYQGGGLIVFLNNYGGKQIGKKAYIQVTKFLPNVVMAEIIEI